MTSKITYFVVAVLATSLVGCATNEGSGTRSAVEAITSTAGTPLPEPSAGFTPTDPLPHAPAKVYAAATAALDAMRIPIVNSSQADGRVTTDYAAGPRYSAAFGLLGSNTTRYKYLVNVRAAGTGSKLTVTAFLESSGNQVQSWRDVSADNPTITAKIQLALIERIEKSLK